MYWVAHLVYLVSPFVARLEPVDSRIILSLLGLRFIDIQMNFMYLNAAWWYFSMLIQFYLIFPLLFWAARRLGPLRFLLIACATGFFARYICSSFGRKIGLWVLGGFRGLSVAGVRARNVDGDVAYSVGCATRMVSPSWRGIRRRPDLVSGRALALPMRYCLRLRRFRDWRLLLLEIVGIAD